MIFMNETKKYKLIMYVLGHSFLPVNNSWLDEIIKLEDDQSIVKIAIKVIYIRFDTQRVHPVSEHLEFDKEYILIVRFKSMIDILWKLVIYNDIRLDQLTFFFSSFLDSKILFRLFKGGIFIEHVCNECQV